MSLTCLLMFESPLLHCVGWISCLHPCASKAWEPPKSSVLSPMLRGPWDCFFRVTWSTIVTTVNLDVWITWRMILPRSRLYWCMIMMIREAAWALFLFKPRLQYLKLISLLSYWYSAFSQSFTPSEAGLGVNCRWHGFPNLFSVHMIYHDRICPSHSSSLRDTSTKRMETPSTNAWKDSTWMMNWRRASCIFMFKKLQTRIKKIKQE